MADTDKDNGEVVDQSRSPVTPLNTRNLRSRDRTPIFAVTKAFPEEPDKGGADSSKRAPDKKKVVAEPVITSLTTPKSKRKFGPEQIEGFPDVYCWECHKVCVEACLDCSVCPRTFHQRCISAAETSADSAEDWTCPVCNVIMRAECASSRTWAMPMLTVEKFAVLLGFALQRMKHSDSSVFQNPVPKSDLPDYYDVIFHPMDLQTLAANVRKKMYASTEAFLEDAKWILHNCIIYNGTSSKFVADAKLIIKICKHEMTEIEVCPDCYYNSSLRKDNWFEEPCTYPHCLVWAKLKGFPYWPAKTLRISSANNVDVRFFGAHDRAWIPLQQCFLLSEECPVQMKSAKKHGLDDAMLEARKHIDRIREKYGFFQFAPPKTDFLPEHLYTCEVLFGNVSDAGKSTDRKQREHAGFSGGEMETDSCLEQILNETSPRRPESGSDNSGNGVESTSADAVAKIVRTEAASMSSGGRMGRVAEKVKLATNSVEATADVPAAPELNIDLSEENTAGVFTLRSSLEEEFRDLPSSVLPDVDDGISRAVLDLAREHSELDNIAARIMRDPTEEASDVAGNSAIVAKDCIGGGGGGGNSDVEILSCEIGQKRPSTSKIGQPQKKRSLTSCLQKLTQTQTQGGKTASPGNSVLDANAVSSQGSEENHVGVRSHLLSKYTAKLSSAFSNILEEFLTELDETETPAMSSASSTALEVKALRAEVNRVTWLQKQAVNELEHNTKLAVAEMQEQLHAERQRALDEQKRRLDDERQRIVTETKRKQWCAMCSKEAMFYCCWNTSYCDYPCQQQHWPKHQETCAQIRHQNSEQHANVPQPSLQNAFITHGPVSVGANMYPSPAAASSSGQVTVQFVPGMVPVYAHGPQIPASGLRPAASHAISAQQQHYPAMQPRPGAGGVLRRR